MAIITEGRRRILIMGEGDIGVVGTTLTDGNPNEINGLAFFDLWDPELTMESSGKFDPEAIADMALHIVFKDPESVDVLMGHLHQVKMSMLKTRTLLERGKKQDNGHIGG